ncbi:uncharacterized protein [Watersipora subatra]|uniref:uncharacterized protein n=1 Tax=Watersipora subatra TaxID=2589382 RepID=UPI00355BF9B1
MSRYDSFQATLQAMLEHRQGNHKRRTDAWTKTEAAQKQTNKQNRQVFLAKQAKNKQLRNREQFQERSKQQITSAKSKVDVTPDKRPVTCQPKKQNNAFLSSNRAFSHRMSSYRTETCPVSHHSDTPEIKKDEDVVSNGKLDEEENVPEVPPTPPKVYNNLKKLSQRNEHTTQIRRIQTAAVKIQRMWRRHRNNFTVIS